MEKATQVGKLLTSTFNNYSPIYKDAYYGTPEGCVQNEWQEELGKTHKGRLYLYSNYLYLGGYELPTTH